MKVEYLYKDILINILNYLRDKEKILFLSTCKTLHKSKNLFEFSDPISIKIILKLSYRKSFTNLIIGNEIFLRNNKKIDKKIDKNFLSEVKKITFGKAFNWNIKSCISSSVTHLTLGDSFNRDIEGCIPSSVR